ncbi:MAG: response regulator [Actinobacteria bacterium]|jgi:excisionase family DNA binding protein|nr:response regulator [Actinomycetota bacterium]
MNQEAAYISTREAAELLGISLRTAQLWVENGALLAWKTSGGHRRILLHSVQKILDERERSAIDLVRAPDARLKVAIVEDDPDVVTLLQMMLTGLDFPCDVQTRSDGFKGLILLGTFRPDVLIADLNMPDMDGFRMLRSIQGSEFAPRKIIVTTALSTSEITERGGVPAEALVLQKPYPLSLLENALRQTYTVSQPL